jgi:hypothetical protein
MNGFAFLAFDARHAAVPFHLSLTDDRITLWALLIHEFQSALAMRRSHRTASVLFEEEGDHAALLGFVGHLYGIGTAAQQYEPENPDRSIVEA